jgi:hypothetical protein
MKRSLRPWLTFVAVSLVLLISCDQDPFGRSTRAVVGDYQLRQWEDFKTYYLDDVKDLHDGGGAIEGVVLRIGWDPHHILVKRRALFGGNEGWMVIDVDSKAVKGPFTDAEISGRRDLSGLKVLRADSAWKKL